MCLSSVSPRSPATGVTERISTSCPSMRRSISASACRDTPTFEARGSPPPRSMAIPVSIPIPRAMRVPRSVRRQRSFCTRRKPCATGGDTRGWAAWQDRCSAWRSELSMYDRAEVTQSEDEWVARPAALERARRFTREAMSLSHCRDDAVVAAGVRSAQAYLAGDLEAELERKEDDDFPALVRLGLGREVEEIMHQHAVLRGLRYKLLRASIGD